MNKTLLAMLVGSLAVSGVQAADTPNIEEMWKIIQLQLAEIQRL
jgi:hypothetical protein